MRKLAAILFLLAAPLMAETGWDLYNLDINDDLDSTCDPGRIYGVIDGDSATDCSVGGGTTAVSCQCNNAGDGYAALGGGGGTPGGSDTQIQVNETSAFQGYSTFTYDNDGTNSTLNIQGTASQAGRLLNLENSSSTDLFYADLNTTTGIQVAITGQTGAQTRSPFWVKGDPTDTSVTIFVDPTGDFIATGNGTSDTANQNHIRIGDGTTASSTVTTNDEAQVVIGNLATASTRRSSVVIGAGSTCASDNCTIIGASASGSEISIGVDANSAASSIAIGDSANASHTNSFALGMGAATTAVQQFVVDAPVASGVINSYWGAGAVDAGATAYSHTTQPTGGSGTDNAGWDFNLAGGRGTGTGDGGDITFQIAPPGTTGSSLNALEERLKIDGANGGTVSVTGGATQTSDIFTVDATPTSTSSSIIVEADGDVLFPGNTATDATNKLHVLIGQGASTGAATSTGQVVIGAGASTGAGSEEAVVIGNNASDTVGADAVVIGAEASTDDVGTITIGRSAATTDNDNIAIGALSNAAGNYSLALGGAADARGGSVALGWSTECDGSASQAVGVGYNVSCDAAYVVAIGSAVDCDDTESICIGASASSTAINQLVIGSANREITDAYIGEGVISATPATLTLHSTGGSGTDIVGGDLELAGGAGTGTGVGGVVSIWTATPGTTSSTPNTLIEAVTVSDEQVTNLNLASCDIYEFNDTGTTISLSVSGTWYGWVSATEGGTCTDGYADFTGDATADRISIEAGGAGDYTCTATASFTGSNAIVVHGAIYETGTIQTNCRFKRDLTAAASVASASTTCILADLANTDYIDLRFMQNTAATKQVDVHSVNLNCHRIGR